MDDEMREHYRDDRNLSRRQSLFDFVVSSSGAADEIIARHARPSAILDAGCGNGLWPGRIRQQGLRGEFHAADLSLGMTRLAAARPDITAAVNADVAALPYADASFDTVLVLWMLYHVTDHAAALREIDRVKAPSGVVIAITNAATSSELDQLIAAALTDTLTYSVDSYLPDLSFTSANGEAILRSQFDDCEYVEWQTDLAIPAVEPIVDFADSIRQPIEARLGRVDWVRFTEALRSRVADRIEQAGAVTHLTRHTAFIAR